MHFSDPDFVDATHRAYEAFRHINRTFFQERLPPPFIKFELTRHSGCFAWASPTGVICLHPTLLKPSSKKPWGIPAEEFGWRFTYDTLLHECIHHRLSQLPSPTPDEGKARTYWTSHNCPSFVAEVQRIGHQLWGKKFVVSMKRRRRVDGSVVETVADDALGFEHVANFPHAGRREFEGQGYYRKRGRPWR